MINYKYEIEELTRSIQLCTVVGCECCEDCRSLIKLYTKELEKMATTTAVSKSPQSSTCICDFHSVLLPYGCRCGGK